MTANSGSKAAGESGYGEDKTIREQARSMGSDAAEGAQNIAEEVREQVREGVAYAREEAERQARDGVHYGADQVARTATALRTAAEELDGTFQGEIFGHAADGLQSLSDDIRDKSIGEIIGDVAVYARRHPVTYLGGAALAGFALARFARASAADGHRQAAGGRHPADAKTGGYGRAGLQSERARTSPVGSYGRAAQGQSARPGAAGAAGNIAEDRRQRGADND